MPTAQESVVRWGILSRWQPLRRMAPATDSRSPLDHPHLGTNGRRRPPSTATMPEARASQTVPYSLLLRTTLDSPTQRSRHDCLPGERSRFASAGRDARSLSWLLHKAVCEKLGGAGCDGRGRSSGPSSQPDHAAPSDDLRAFQPHSCNGPSEGYWGLCNSHRPEQTCGAKFSGRSQSAQSSSRAGSRKTTPTDVAVRSPLRPGLAGIEPNSRGSDDSRQAVLRTRESAGYAAGGVVPAALRSRPG